MTASETTADRQVGVISAAGRWPLRTLRAVAFSASSAALAVGAHRLAGGMQPAGWVVAAGALSLLVFGLVWSRRERGGPAIAAVVLASQLVLHAVFTFAPAKAMGVSGPSEVDRWAAMLLCHDAGNPATLAQVNGARALLGLGPLATAPPAMHMDSPLTVAGAGMLAAHLAAAAVMAWWLRRGERAVWSAARHVVRAVLSAGRLITPISPSGAPVVWGAVWEPGRWIWGTGLLGRGPPSGHAPVLTA